ncbi:MAG: Sec-independent protein translocase protein TatB [Gammaproteobacteria bacterium]
MFDIGFTELIVIGVVALIVIGPERLPKVARTAGHLFGRMQRYVSTVKSDISREIELEELRKAGQSFRESVESVNAEVQQEATRIDDYFRDEADRITQVTEVMGETEGERPVTQPALKSASSSDAQQSLPLDEPDPYAAAPHAVVEVARGAHDKTAA